MTNPNDPAAGGTLAPQPPPPPMAPAGTPPPGGAPRPAAGAQAADALNDAMATLRTRFSTAELLAGGGALLVLAVFVLFGVILNAFWVNDVTFATSAALLFVIGAQRMGLYDFGAGQRSLIVVLGFLMGAMLVEYVLYYVRRGSFGDGTFLIGLVITWVGQALAAAGAFMLWRGPRT
jgi:hypothetical protein